MEIATNFSNHSKSSFKMENVTERRSRRPRGIRRAFVAARLLGLRVQIPREDMNVVCELCVERYRSLRWAYYSSRGILSILMCLSVIAKPRQGGGLGPLGAVEP